MKKLLAMGGRLARALSLLLAAVTLCLTAFPALAAESATAATMQLMKTEGTVNVTNASGRGLTKRNNMRLYNGYHVETKAKSYAWINLDDSKLVKLDAVSEAEVRKSGKALELLLSSGSFYFNVTSPLKEGETLNIRTATMVVGIRGTSGWFKAVDRWSTEIYVLEGTVQCSVSDPVTGQVKEAAIRSGEMAVATAYPQDWEGDKCGIVQEKFEPGDIDGFVLEELAQDPDLCGEIFEKSGLDVLSAVESTQERREQDEQKMQDALDRIGEQRTEQDGNTSTGPVWRQEGPAPNKPDSSAGDSNGGNSGGDNSGDVQGGATAPVQPVVELTMPQDAEVVQGYLDTSGVEKVVLLAGSTSGQNTLDVDIVDMIIPGGKTLALSEGVDLSIRENASLTIDGKLTGQGALMNYGVLINNDTGLIELETLTTTNKFASKGIVKGRITQTGGDFEVTDGEINGDVLTSGSTTSTIENATIKGSVSVSNGGSVTVKNATITGGISKDDSSSVTVDGEEITGNPQTDDNSGSHKSDEIINSGDGGPGAG